MPAPLPQFVAERRATWTGLSNLLDTLRQRPLAAEEVEQLDRLYRHSSADLARARLWYPGSEATQVLNALVARAYGSLYAQRPARWQAIRRFYLETFPQSFYRERWGFYAAWGILLAGGWIGSALTIAHPELVPALVPLEVREHLAEQRLWTDSILQVMPPALLSARILTNNLGVAFSTFVGGLFAGVGTVLSLLFNGISLGAIISLAAQHHVGGALVGFILAHGLLELSSLALAGQAGLVLASGVVAPGALTRADAIRERGRLGVQIVLGSAPLFFAAGWVEGFVSPGDTFPAAVRAALGLSLAAILYLYLYRWGRRA